MIKMSQRERDVFCAYEMDAMRPQSAVLRLTRGKAHQLAYTRRRLMELGLLGQVRPAFNVYALGLSDFAFFFSLAANGTKRRQAFIHALEQSPSVAWCAEIGGAWQYAASFVAKHVHHVYSELNRLAADFEGNVNGQVALRVLVESYGRKYLSRLAYKSSTPWFGGPPGAFTINPEDHTLLRFLAGESWDSWREAARQTGLSVSMVQRKLHAWEAAGFVTGYYHAVDPFKLGVQVFNLLVHCRSIAAGIGARLKQFAREHPNVVHFIQCFGSWDFELVVECEDARQAVEVAASIQDRFAEAIETVEVIPVFGYLKVNQTCGIVPGRENA